MIVSGKNVIGLKIVTIVDGTVIQTVDDVAYNPTTQRVEALLVDSGGLFSSAKAIDMDDVHNIGQDAVIVHDAGVIKPVGQLADSIHSISDANKYLVRTKVLTIEGLDLGTVNDLQFDSKTGEVDSIEVSQGAFKSKKFVKPGDIVTVGKDATIVSTYTEEAFEQQAAETGVAGFINDTKAQLAETADAIKEKTRDGVEKVKDIAEDQATNFRRASNDMADRTRVAAAKLQESADEAMVLARERTEEAAVATRRVARDVSDRTKEVTTSTIDNSVEYINAKEKDMNKLTDKISGKAKQAAGDLTNDKKLKAEGKAQEIKADLKDKADEVVDKASQKLDEFKKNINK
ncbi:MAG: PRC-barrel domain-containing protein [Candidatus Microsaccharimonas sp.]